MNQYDIYTVAGYQDFSKPRPCVLIETKMLAELFGAE
jgi:hypothetical protein